MPDTETDNWPIVPDANIHPPYTPPAGNVLVIRRKRAPLGGPPAVHFVAGVAPAGNVTALTAHRSEALRMDATAASKTLEFYADRDPVLVGEFATETR